MPRSLGVHMLQACARRAGFEVCVYYANLHLAAFLGEHQYNGLCQMPLAWLIGERLFARAAYGARALGHDGGARLAREADSLRGKLGPFCLDCPAELPGLRLSYEEKSNLTRRKVKALVEAGVREVQLGIEALSTGLLRLMSKGVTAAQNVAALRTYPFRSPTRDGGGSQPR
jgi:hypothetical protein